MVFNVTTKLYDIAIIGAGIIGTSIARELSRYKLNTLVIEKESEITNGTSKANSGIIHAGFDAQNGTKKARFNVLGSEMMPKLAKELQFPYRQNGALVINFYKRNHFRVQALYENVIKNGVKDLKILDKKALFELEPNLNKTVHSALFAPSSAVVSPYEMVIAFAENATENGVDFALNCRVVNIENRNEHFEIYGLMNNASSVVIKSKMVINAAGLYSDEINNMLCSKKRKIVPKKGEYILLDKTAGNFFDRTVFQLPTRIGKGVLISPTVQGNLLLGPTSYTVQDKTATETSYYGLQKVIKASIKTSENVPLHKTINSFAGLRANVANEKDDFILDSENGFINLLNINSPGLSAAPAIAKHVANIVKKALLPQLNPNFNPNRRRILRFVDVPSDEQNELIQKDKRYGKIICRCELVSEAEVVDSIRRPLGANTLDGVKRRTRCMMGECQGTYCGSKVLYILAKELGKSIYDLTKHGGKSNILE
jgi:glycerol-3-phosphate dehydrogenase